MKLKKVLQDVVNPDDITGTTKKFEVTVSGSTVIDMVKTVEVLAHSGEEAEAIVERLYNDAEIYLDAEADYESGGGVEEGPKFNCYDDEGEEM